MASARTCPICMSEIESGQTACSRCGFRLNDATASFKPVAVPAASAAESGPKKSPCLRVAKGPYSGQEFFMTDGEFTIGRDPSCDIFLSNTTVSRLHAKITISGENAVVEDCGSTNGTWLDGSVIDRSPLKPGQYLQVGNFDMVFEQKTRH